MFDEPTLYLSIEREIDFFKTIEKLSEKMQIIIATNSTFCFGLNANYIELEKNYILSQTKLLNGYFKKLSDNLQLKLLGLTKEELISMIKKYSGRKVDIDGQNYLICDNMPIIGETKCILLSWEYLDKIELIYFLCNLINKYNNVQEL